MMEKQKGFTLIELMVVIMIVAILASVATPVLRGRIDAAKWSEGKAMLGTIATALKTYAAEKAADGTYPPDMKIDLGFFDEDLTGKYFAITDFTITSATYSEIATPRLQFVIQATAPAGKINSPSVVTLNHTGTWVETP